MTVDCIPNPFENTIAGIIITHVSIIIAIIGIPVNVLTLIVLRRATSKGPTNLLLVVLATEDILIIISYSIYYVATHYFENYHLTYLGLLKYADSVIYFLLSWIKVTEIYTIVLLSLQRYVAIRWPLQVARLCSVGRTKRTLIAVILLSAMLKLPNLILGYQTVEFHPECGQHVLNYVFGSEPWFDNFKLIHVQILDQVIGYFIPLSALIVLNCGLITRVRKAIRQRTEDEAQMIAELRYVRENRPGDIGQVTHMTNATNSDSGSNCSQPNTQRTNNVLTNKTHSAHASSISHASTQSKSVTITLIGVVSTFIIFETPTTICFCYEIWQQVVSKQDDWGLYHYLYPTALVCVLINCTSNFFIYMFVGSKFRKACVAVTKELCSHRYWRRRCHGKSRKRERIIGRVLSQKERTAA